MVAQAHTFTLDGPSARHVVVELDVRPGLPAFTIVGLADPAVREARERIQTAIRNSGFQWPPRRITANLAPGDLRKAGPGLDLPLACAILAATGQVPAERLRQIAMFGELGLDGSVRPAQGTLAVADAARRCGLARLAVASAASHAAGLVEQLEIAPLGSLRSAARLLRGGPPDPPPQRFAPGDGPSGAAAAPGGAAAAPGIGWGEPELADVRGLADAVRALLIAAAGAHNLLLIGPPGVGKTMLARRLPGILPPLDAEEAIELARIRGVAPAGVHALERRRPFRAPHHTTTAAGLVGGAGNGWLGEVTLAHRGALFLDEVTEFPRSALEALRQPLEEGRVTIARARASVVQPASFMLLCATNPCPCGGGGERRCPQRDRERHARKLSGPLLDRIDLIVRVEAPASIAVQAPALSTAAARAAVAAARERQRARLAPEGVRLNAEMDRGALARRARLDRGAVQARRGGAARIAHAPRAAPHGQGRADHRRPRRAERIAARDVAAAIALRHGAGTS